MVTHVDREKLERRWDDIKAAAEEEIQSIRDDTQALIAELRQKFEQHKAMEKAAGEGAETGDVADDPEQVDVEDLSDVALALLEREDDELTFATEQELNERIKAEEEAANEREGEVASALELLEDLERKQLITEIDYRNVLTLVGICEARLEGSFGDIFAAGLGGAAIKELLTQIDLDEMAHELRKEIDERTGARRARAIKRLGVVEAFRKSKNRPEWMSLDVIPALPPELRPMVQLDGGRFATSDLNDLYRRIINRNNRLRRIVEIKAPESIINHERRLLQEAVDALIDNGRRARPVTGSNKRPLKSLSDMLKGKEGRFRKNLLGKRVDYSGRSVIVVGPELHLNQCGLPREMALELFKPFVMKRLVEKGYTTNIKTAKRMVDRLRPEVWDALEEVIQEHPILLNRAPTLHRLGIQAFEPVLVDGKAIQLHPLVCQAFNADFDGDQMAAHVPLSMHAQAEARLLMLATRNIFKPADGRPICAPLYDIVLGCYYLTQIQEKAKGHDTVYPNADAAIQAYYFKELDLHAPIKVRVPEIAIEAERRKEPVELDHDLARRLRAAVATGYEAGAPLRELHAQVTSAKKLVPEDMPEPDADRIHHWEGKLEDLVRLEVGLAIGRGRCPLRTKISVSARRRLIETTVGRTIFNESLPLDLRFINKEVARDELAEITDACHRAYGPERTTELLDSLKQLGFGFATRAGISICLDNTRIDSDRDRILDETDVEVAKVNKAHEDGQITPGERQQRVLQLYNSARENVANAILDNIDRFNPIFMMVNSGARANRTHICQISGMRGLMSDPFGRLIEDLPVKSNFHEGLNVLEYFVSTHGARKGLADVALRTADAGYLTRRLVDVAQDVIVTDLDCGTSEGISVTPVFEEETYCSECGEEDLRREGTCEFCGTAVAMPTHGDVLEQLAGRITGRITPEDVIHPDSGDVLVAAGEEITREAARAIEEGGIVRVKIRSPLTCELQRGICQQCYGRDLATGRMVDVGTAIGIIAAQSIGEPGTQLTMRTFHTGGIGQEYITGVAEVKKKKQEALRGLHEDIDRGIVSVGGAERERTRAIQRMLKVLEDPIHGLLRVVELFEARKPKGEAITAEADGVVAAIDRKGLRTVIIHSDLPLSEPKLARGERAADEVVHPDTKKSLVEAGGKLTEKLARRMQKAGLKSVKVRAEHLVPYRGKLHVRSGQRVRPGDRLTDGPIDPQSVLAMKGVEGVQEYLLREIQRVYKSQGVEINDKHVEVIIRQMLKKRRIVEHGDTDFLAGQIVDRFAFARENARVAELGGNEATAEWVLLGITEASLATDSFLSAASFQRTTRVLAEAATGGKRDHLVGLKENVIIGRLIPAGSGMPEHRGLLLRAPELSEPENGDGEGVVAEEALELALAADADVEAES
jgi:DNA-directed RNA polymerase subunit beta'